MGIEYPLANDYDALVEQLAAARNEIHRLNLRIDKQEAPAEDLRREYRLLSHHAHEVLFTADAKGEITYIAEGVESLLGYTPAELVGRRLRELVAQPEERSLAEALQSLNSEGGGWIALRHSVRSATGRTVPTLIVAMRLTTRRSSGDGVIGLLRDVSEYSEKEADLRRHAGILNAVADSARRFLSSANWRDQIAGFLEEIASAAHVCRAYLFENFYDLRGHLHARLMEQWVRRRDPAQPELPAEISYDDEIFSIMRRSLEQNSEIVNIRQASDPLVRRFVEERRIRGQYILPVSVDNSWWGFLGFDEWYDDRSWSPAEAQAFRTAGRILGAAIRQSETNQRLHQIERLTRVQRNIALRLSSVDSIDGALQSVADGIMGFEMRSVAVRDPSPQGIHTVHRGWPQGMADHIDRQTRTILGTLSPSVHQYFAHDDLDENRAYKQFADSSVRSLAVLPVASGHRILGVIILGSVERDYIPPVLQETLEAIAFEIAGVLVRLDAEHSAQRNRERVLEANERYALATSAGRVGVWDYRRTVGFHLSPMLQSMLQQGGNADTNPWTTLLGALPGENRQELPSALRSMIRGRSDQFEIEVPLQHESGEDLWFSFRAHCYRDQSGRIERIIGTASDVTDQKRLEEQLRRSSESSESLSRAKSRFLAHMSHELKTPLNGIIGYAQVLQRSAKVSPEQRDAIDVISRSAGHLLHLIEDVLDASRLESGKLGLQEKEFNLPVFLQDIAEIVRIQAREKALRLSLVKETNLPVFVQGDEKRLRQILLNLLNNAVRFTPEGSVSLCAGWYAGSIRFSVKDTGVGIPESVTEQIFEPFYQVEGQNVPSEGSGLGLAITRQLLELMGQELHVESKVAVGTEVWFLFPHQEAEDAWDLATTEDYIAPLEDIQLEHCEGISESEVATLIQLAEIGDIGAMEMLLGSIAARSRTTGPVAERALRYLREFRISELKELVRSLGKPS